MTNGSPSSYHFSIWLFIFAGILLSIPLFIWFEFIVLAKICGVTVLVLLLFAMRRWFALARINNNRVERKILTANDLYVLQQVLPLFKRLTARQQRILKDQLGLFLAEVRFNGDWPQKTQFSVGLLVVLSTWDTGYINKQNWQLVLTNANQFFIEEQPNHIVEIPSVPFAAKSFEDLLSLAEVLNFKKSALI